MTGLPRRGDRIQTLAAELGDQAIAIEADVTDRDSISAAAERVKTELGSADILINNAGVMLLAPFSSDQRAELRQMIEVNLLGAITATEVFLDQLRDGGGDLVNISSVAGRTARPGNAGYAATKWGMNGWSESLRQELQPDVRVIVIEPGAVATELTDHITHTETKAGAEQMYREDLDIRAGHRRGHRLRNRPPAQRVTQRDPHPTHRTGSLIRSAAMRRRRREAGRLGPWRVQTPPERKEISGTVHQGVAMSAEAQFGAPAVGAGTAKAAGAARIVLMTLAAGQFVMALDTTVMNTAIATVAKDVGTTVTGIQTAITLYTLVMASLMITGGKVGQMIGRKRAFGIGCIIYACGSLTTALSPNLTVLMIGWSGLEGLGAVLIMPAIVALVASNFGKPERPRAYGLVAAAGAIAAALGPLVGGLFTTYASWRWVFAGEVLIVLVILVLARRMNDTPAEEGARLDLVGTALSALGLGRSCWAFSRPGPGGSCSPSRTLLNGSGSPR